MKNIMGNSPAALEQRLQDIARVLREDGRGLALLGLGSVGLEVQRLDQWSDLDFFAIVVPGSKRSFLEDPSWLDRAHPVSYRFQNTPDGFKLLFADGIFGEMAVFEAAELEQIPFAEGRVVWAREGFDTELLKPRSSGGRLSAPPGEDHILGELLTCLYVGLCRFRRGEKLSAWRFIQGYCLDRVLELAEHWFSPAVGPDEAPADPYNRERRSELRYPQLAELYSRILPGYDQSPQAALALLDCVEQHRKVNPALAAEIRRLAGAHP